MIDDEEFTARAEPLSSGVMAEGASPPVADSDPVPVPEDVVDFDDDGIPDAVEAADVAPRARMLRTSDLDAVAGRGVQWVRTSDLLAQQATHLAGRGFDFQTGLVERARTTVRPRIRDLTDRARRLPPLSAFGRGTQEPGAAGRSGVGAI